MPRSAVWVLAFALVIRGVSTGHADDVAPPALPAELPPTAQVPSSPSPSPAAKAADPADDKLNFKPEFMMRGRLEIDSVVAPQSAGSVAQLGRLNNGFGFRRARLGARGTVGDAANWIAEFELAGGDVRFRDVYVGLTVIPVIRQVNIGFFREPFSLEGTTSANYITFMERSPLNALDPTRQWGVCGYWWPDSERMTYAIGAFRTGTDNFGFSGEGGYWSVATRVTGLPIYEDDGDVFRLVHLGVAFSQRHPADNVAQYRPNQQSNLLVVTDQPVEPFLPTVVVPSNNQQLYNLQGAWVGGPRSIQSEWFGTTIQQIGGGTVFLHGMYVYGSYFLTGEHRSYNKTRAGFDQINVLRPVVRNRGKPGTGWGAIELAARFSISNYDSANLPPPPSSPSSPATAPNRTILYQWTLGANWYLNSNIRLMANYSFEMPVAPGQAVLPVNLFSLRTAIFW